jgi:hypothetical protein
VDYEVRRELLWACKITGIGRLDALKGSSWLHAHHDSGHAQGGAVLSCGEEAGRQSATDASLDADMILAAQATILAGNHAQAVIATTNVRHLALFASASIWREIR